MNNLIKMKNYFKLWYNFIGYICRTDHEWHAQIQAQIITRIVTIAMTRKQKKIFLFFFIYEEIMECMYNSNNSNNSNNLTLIAFNTLIITMAIAIITLIII